MRPHNNRTSAKKAVEYLLEQLREYGLEIELYPGTFQVFIVDINDKWGNRYRND